MHDTPDTPTIATLVDWANDVGLGREITAADTLKNVLLKVRQPGGEWELLAVGVPGDREVDEKRLGAALDPAEYALLDDADFAKNPFLVKGYVGPKALKANGVRYLVDPRIVDGTAWITGADAPNKHVVGLVAGRDFVADGTIEAAEVRDGDPSPDGAGPLVAARGIEIGHIFQLGRKYTDAFSADVLGEDGKPVRLTMGSYGIGVSRLVAVIAEQHHDELGLRWPSSVSPFDAHIVIANKDSAARDGAGRAGRRPGPAGCRGAARRPEVIAGGEVQGRRAARGAVDRGGRPRLGRRGGRAAQPVQRRDARDRRRWRGPGDRRRRSPASATRLPPGKATVIGHTPSTRLQRAAVTAVCVSAFTAKARCSVVVACSSTARHATAESSSMRTARFAASFGLSTSVGS